MTAGASFVGGANAAGATARCVPALVATLRAPVACGASFQLEVSANGASSFSRAGDAVFAGSCNAALPSAVRAPVVHGRPLVGRVLSATPAVWSETPTSVRYQWQRCAVAECNRIGGATTLALRLTRRDARHSVRIVATAAFDRELVQTASNKVAIARR